MGGGTLVLARLRAAGGLAIACSVLITLVAVVLVGLVSLDRGSRTDGLRQRLTSLPAEQQVVTVTVRSDEALTEAGPADGAQDEVHARGITAVVATHDPVLVAMADRVVELADGQVVADTASQGVPA